MHDFLNNIVSFHKSLIVGFALAATCSLLSVFVVLRRMAMISEAVAHAGIGGIAVALLAGYFFPATDGPVMQQIITGIFCLGTALAIGYVTRTRRVTEDSAIGIFLVASMALGILLLSVRSKFPVLSGQTRPASIESVLFGDLISVTTTDMWIALVVPVVVFGLVIALYNEFLYTTLDEQMARINGVNTRLINTLQLAMISLVIVVGVRMVGALMITAMTILPGATACMISRRFNGVLVGSLLVGILGIGGALLLAINPPLSSYTSGPVLVLTLFLIFVVVWGIRHIFKPKIEYETVVGGHADEHDHEHENEHSQLH